MVLCKNCKFGIGSTQCNIAFETLPQNKPPLTYVNQVIGCSNGKKKPKKDSVIND